MFDIDFVAKQIHNYMTFRAKCENVGHTLTVSFYIKSLEQGFRNLLVLKLMKMGCCLIRSNRIYSQSGT